MHAIGTTVIPILQKKKLNTSRLGNFPKDTQLVNDRAPTLATLLMEITSQERQTYKEMSIRQCDKCQDIQSAKRTQILLAGRGVA